MFYKIEIEEIFDRIVEVEASSEEEAYKKVRELYYNNEIVLNSNDYCNTNMYILDNNNERIQKMS